MKIARPWLHAARLADQLLFFPALLLVIWGGLTATEPQIVEQVNDKTLHFIAYFGLSAMAAAAFRPGRRVLFVCLGLIALGGILEIVQGFTGRDMSIFDEIANTIGVVVGGTGSWASVEALRRRLD